MGYAACPVILTVALLFPQYGEVLNLVLSRKKAGNAIVEFASVRAAVSAVWGLGTIDKVLAFWAGAQFHGPTLPMGL